jgi:gliding motility-associated-like protein
VDTFTYFVTQSSGSTTCESPYTEVVYIIQPNPAAYQVMGGGTYCEGTGGKEISLDYSDSGTNYELRLDGNTYLTNIPGNDGTLSFGQIKPEGTYTVYGTASNGCTAKMTGTALISVDSLPESAGTITGDSIVCQGTTGIEYTVPEIPYADKYVWSIPDGTEITAGHDSRTVTLHYSDTAQSGMITVYGSNSCDDGAVSTGHAITVNELPASAGTISGPANICQGADGVSFEVPLIDHASEYVWSVPSGATIVSGAGTRSILVNFDDASTGGVVRVHGRNSCGSGSSSPDHSVSVTAKPILVTDTYKSVCASSDSLIADDPGSATIQWDRVDGQGTIASPSSFETEVTGLGTGINAFEVALTSSGCSDLDTVMIENNKRFVNAGADQTLCSGTYNLSGNKPESGVSGNWSVQQGAATFADATQYNTSVTGLQKGVNVLRWTLTRNGCSSYDEVTLINDSPTQAEAGIDQKLCGDSTFLDANTPSVGGGHWTIQEGYVSFQTQTDPKTRIRDVAKGDNLLQWTITNNACSSSDTVHVLNNQVDVEAGPDQVICDYKTSMDAHHPVKGQGEWSIIKGSATFEDRLDPKSDVYLLISDTTVLAWNVYYNGCQSADSVTIINNSPSRAEAGDDQAIFQDNTFLDATAPAKGTGEWSLLTGSAIFQDKLDPKTEVTGLAYGKNLFQWKVTYMSCVSIDSVTVDNQSSGSVTAGQDTIICTDAVRLNASEPVQGEGEWSVVKGSAIFDNKNDNNTVARNLARGENVLKWTVIGNGVVSDKVKIVNNAPTQANAGPDMAYCVDSAQLTANNASVGTGVWSLIAGEGTFVDSTLNNTRIHNLGTGKNTLRWTITNKNCQSSDEVIVTNNQPTPADAGVDQTLCSDEATLYGNSPAVGEGLWTLVSGSGSVEFQDQTVGNTRVFKLGHGDNVLRWTITNENCVSSDKVTITNDNPTTANAGRDKSICVDSFRLNANEAVIGTGKWSVINGYGDLVNPTDHESMVKNLDKGGNLLRWTIKHNGCISYDEVEISNDFIKADAGYDQSLCVDSTSLTANNAGVGDGYWSVVTGSAVFEDPSNPNTKVSNLDHRSDNVLKWTITNASCTSADQVTIENNSPGIVYAGEDDEICDNTYYLKANPNYMGDAKWEALSGGGTIVNDTAGSTRVKDMGLGRNTFRWSVRRDGCVKYDDVTVYNNLPVEAYAGENDTTCSTSYTLHAEEPPFGQGQWTVVAGSGNFAEDSLFNTTVTNLSQGANTFKWTVYNGRCSTEDEVTIVVNRPNTPRAGADQEICADSTVLQANKPGQGQTGHWEVVEGSGSFEDPSNPNTKVTHMGYGTNTYRWNISYRGCNLYDEVTITNNMPTIANAGQDIHVCGDQVRLNAINPSIGTGRWSLVSGQAQFSDPTDPSTLVSNLGFGPNTLRWTTTNGKCSSLDDITVYNDKANAYAGVDQEVYRDSTTLVANSVSRGEGRWIILGGSGTFRDPSASQTTVRDLSGGVNTFRWTIDNNGCISSDEMSVTYYVMPDPEFDVSNDRGCPPLSVQFFNESLKVNSNFTWTFGDGNISTNENPRHTYYQSGEYEVQLKTKGPDGTTVTEDTTIVVHEVPEASFDVAPDHLYIPEQHLQGYDMSIGADRYLWHFGDDSTSTRSSPMHHYQDTGTFDIRLEVWSMYDCYDDTVQTNAVSVERSGKIKFPSGFTPNPNGPVGGHYNRNSRDNDVFHPIVRGVVDYHLEIFNRWGVMVFQSDQVEVGWDGYYQGKPAEEGVYIYKVHGTYNNGTRFEKVGDFVLIRK